MKKILVSVLALLASASVAAADGGINLAWDDCGAHGTQSKSFDCASNSGPLFSLYGSFVAPTGVNNFVGIQAQISITSQSTLPQWWQHGTGFCRGAGALTSRIDFSNSSGICLDPYNSVNSIVAQSYDVMIPSPNQATLKIQAAIPVDEAHALTAGSEYYAFHVDINRSKSSAPNNCVGCSEPICIVLQDIDVFQSDNTDNDLTSPANANGALWQPPVAGCNAATGARTNSTWGQVKSLYR